jgi:ATP-binding cassette subfamily B protein
MKDRTSIIIAHRVSTIKNADKILVMDDGKIAEFGNHEYLMRLKGIYFELYEKQLLEEEQNA